MYQNYLKIHPNCLNEDEKKYLSTLLSLSKSSDVDYSLLLEKNNINVRYMFKHLKKTWICIGIIKTNKGRIKCYSSHCNKQKSKELTSKMLWTENTKKRVFDVSIEDEETGCLLNDDEEIDNTVVFHLEQSKTDINEWSYEEVINNIREKLKEKDLMDIVEDTSILDKENRLWIIKDDLAKSLIISLLPCELLTEIGLKSSSKEMWNTLLLTCGEVSDDEYIIIS